MSNCSPEKHEEWRKKAVERHDKAAKDLARIFEQYGRIPANEETEKLWSLVREAFPCPHCGATIYIPPPEPKYTTSRAVSDDIERYSRKDRVLTDEGKVETRISKQDETAADAVTAAEKVIENRSEDEDTDTVTNAAPVTVATDSLQRGFIGTSGRIGTPGARGSKFRSASRTRHESTVDHHTGRGGDLR